MDTTWIKALKPGDKVIVTSSRFGVTKTEHIATFKRLTKRYAVLDMGTNELKFMLDTGECLSNDTFGSSRMERYTLEKDEAIQLQIFQENLRSRLNRASIKGLDTLDSEQCGFLHHALGVLGL